MPAASSTPLDVAFFMSNGEDATTCVVKLPDAGEIRFSGIGRDEDGAFLQAEDGDFFRIASKVPDDFDSMMEHPTLRLSLIDGEGHYVDEYDIAHVAPAAAFGSR